MKILLDTQIYLWFLGDSSKLSSKAKTHIIEAEDVFISAASIWEAAIKVKLGRLEVSVDDLIHGIEAVDSPNYPSQQDNQQPLPSFPPVIVIHFTGY
ncbi:MAG: hypothetical protein KC643_33715 [Nitrospira sp.]|nr:hypothetical protein [Nitrospira sp.]